MKLFKVDGGVLRVSPGTTLALTKAQISARTHALAKIAAADMPKGEARLDCEATQALEFKAGEIVKIAAEDIAKPFRDKVIEVSSEAGNPVTEKPAASAKGKSAAPAAAAASPAAQA